MAVEDLFEDQEHAEFRFFMTCMRLAWFSKGKAKSKVKSVIWIRKPQRNCYICGASMAQPGEYRAIEGRKVCCWECYEALPVCVSCGKGTGKQYCRECIGKK